MVTSDPGTWIARLFPQSVEEPEVPEDPYDISNTEGEWVFTEEMTPQKAQELLEELRQQRHGVLTAEDLEDDEGEWQ